MKMRKHIRVINENGRVREVMTRWTDDGFVRVVRERHVTPTSTHIRVISIPNPHEEAIRAFKALFPGMFPRCEREKKLVVSF